MLLSIITINYKNLAGLRKTAESVISQSCRDFEWIIIDGGSSDGSKEYIEQLAADSVNNISYWCSESDKGVYNAMNKGIKHVSGDYIIFMNSGDTFYEPTTIEKVKPFLQSCESDIYVGDCLAVSSMQKQLISYANKMNLYHLYKNSFCHQAMFTKSSWCKKIMFNESYKIAADYAFCLNLVKHKCIFSHLGCIVCCYDMSGLSNDSNFSELHILERKRAQNTFFPPMILNFYEDCLALEQTKDFQHFINIVSHEGITLWVMRLYFKIVEVVAKIKTFV